MTVLPVETIDYVKAEDDYVLLRASAAGTTSSSRRSRASRRRSRRQRFVRIHRSYLLNLDRLQRVGAFRDRRADGGPRGRNAAARQPRGRPAPERDPRALSPRSATVAGWAGSSERSRGRNGATSRRRSRARSRRDDDRAGPVPPPPRTAHAPGVAVYEFGEIPAPCLLRLATGTAGFFLEGEERDAGASALLVLLPPGAAGAARRPRQGSGRPAAPLSRRRSSLLPLFFIRRNLQLFSPPTPPHQKGRPRRPRRLRHHGPARCAHAADGITVLRLGPPPGARWVFVGLHAIAVFAGRVTLVDGGEAKLVPAGRIALVGRPDGNALRRSRQRLGARRRARRRARRLGARLRSRQPAGRRARLEWSPFPEDAADVTEATPPTRRCPPSAAPT